MNASWVITIIRIILLSWLPLAPAQALSCLRGEPGTKGTHGSGCNCESGSGRCWVSTNNCSCCMSHYWVLWGTITLQMWDEYSLVSCRAVTLLRNLFAYAVIYQPFQTQNSLFLVTWWNSNVFLQESVIRSLCTQFEMPKGQWFFGLLKGMGTYLVCV